MRVFRSFRAVSMAALAAVVAFVWAMHHGTPGPFARAAALGADSLDARGGVVLDLTLHAPDARARDAALDVIERRLAHFGDVSLEPHGDGVRATVLDAPSGDPYDLARTAKAGGRLDMRLVEEQDDELSVAIAGLRDVVGPDVTVDVDTWTPEDSNERHRLPFLVSHDPDALRRVVARLPGGGEGRVVLELVTPEPHARDRSMYWRTYVVEPGGWAVNADIADAHVGWDPNTNKPIVLVDFTAEGGRRFGEITAANVGRKLAILIDGHVSSAPIINGPIRGGTAIITMGGSDLDHMQEEADDLVDVLAAGQSIPFTVDAHVVQAEPGDRVRIALGRTLFALTAALLALLLAWPLVRWPALRRAPTSSGRPAEPSRWGRMVPRALVTAGVIAALVGLAHVVAPGVDGAVIPHELVARTQVTLAALGVAPVVVAFLLVALYGLIDPGWAARRDRRAGATVAIAAGLALIEGWGHATYLSRIVFDDPVVPPDARWEAAAAMAGGVALYALGALAIDRWGLGRGWSAVLALDVVRALSEQRETAPSWSAWLSAGAIAAIVLFAARTRVGGGESGRGVRLPIAGFVGAAAAPLAILLLWRPLQLFLPFEAYRLAAQLERIWFAIPIAIGIAAALAWLGSHRLPGADRARAIGLDVAIAAALTALPFAVGLAPSLVIEIALAAAALADVLAEARARARGAWSSVAEVHDVDAADELLDGAAAPRLARGLHVRALLRGLGPMVPIEVLEAQSPEAQVLEASLASARLVAD